MHATQMFEQVLDRLAIIEQAIADLSMLEDEVLDINGAVAFTGISKSRIYDMAPKGRIPNSKVGGRLRFSKLRLKRWLLEENYRPSEREIQLLAKMLL